MSYFMALNCVPENLRKEHGANAARFMQTENGNSDAKRLKEEEKWHALLDQSRDLLIENWSKEHSATNDEVYDQPSQDAA
jgi:hypothetical protein